MKKYILVLLSCSWLSLGFADYCWVNKQWDKYCTYDNWCYEYWNKNGTHYDSCNPNNKTSDSSNKVKFIDTINSFDGIFSWFWVLFLSGTFIAGLIYSFYGSLVDHKQQQSHDNVAVSPVKISHPIIKHEKTHTNQVLSWYSQLNTDSRNALSPFYNSLLGVNSKKVIIKMINEHYEKNLSHIYSSEDKVYQDLFSLKNYL